MPNHQDEAFLTRKAVAFVVPCERSGIRMWIFSTTRMSRNGPLYSQHDSFAD